MPRVPWSTRLGDIGQSEIESRLRHFSTVHPYHRDLGIDYYCELLEDDRPSTPFYVQAKSTGHFDDSWRSSIKTKTITYWLGQPHPVFLIVYNEKNDLCHWMSIEHKRYDLVPETLTAKDTTNLKMDRGHVLKKGKGMNDEFISKVEEDARSIALWLGHPQPAGKGYVKTIPPAPRSPKELSSLKEQVRMNIYSLVQHYLFQVHDLTNARLLCEFLARFDRSHFNQFFWLAMIDKQQGNKEAAIENCKLALEICERHQQWPRESMENIKGGIKRLMEDP